MLPEKTAGARQACRALIAPEHQQEELAHQKVEVLTAVAFRRLAFPVDVCQDVFEHAITAGLEMQVGRVLRVPQRLKAYKPDTSPKEITSVPGTLQKHSENTCLSCYVWLPIEWEGEKPVIRWQKEWRITDL